MKISLSTLSLLLCRPLVGHPWKLVNIRVLQKSPQKMESKILCSGASNLKFMRTKCSESLWKGHASGPGSRTLLGITRIPSWSALTGVPVWLPIPVSDSARWIPTMGRLTEFQASGFIPAVLWLPRVSVEWTSRWRISSCLFTTHLCLSYFQISKLENF